MTPRSALVLALAMARIGFGSWPAWAEPTVNPTPAASPVRPHCGSDIEKFCPNVVKGKGVIRQCLAEHAAALSPGCIAAMADYMAKHHAKPKGQ